MAYAAASDLLTMRIPNLLSIALLGGFIPFALAAAALTVGAPTLWLSAVLVVGLLLFGFVFAINSSVHSYLILAFSNQDRVTRDVGFYYMANAAGRLIGTLLSGVSYQLGGLPPCLATAGVMAALGWVATRRIRTGP